MVLFYSHDYQMILLRMKKECIFFCGYCIAGCRRFANRLFLGAPRSCSMSPFIVPNFSLPPCGSKHLQSFTTPSWYGITPVLPVFTINPLNYV